MTQVKDSSSDGGSVVFMIKARCFPGLGLCSCLRLHSRKGKKAPYLHPYAKEAKSERPQAVYVWSKFPLLPSHFVSGNQRDPSLSEKTQPKSGPFDIVSWSHKRQNADDYS
jgi:hypothetical protein